MTLQERKDHLRKTGKRICRDCDTEFPDSLEYFFANSHGRLNWICKDCYRSMAEKYRKNKVEQPKEPNVVRTYNRKPKDEYNTEEEIENYNNLLSNLKEIQSKITELIKDNTIMVLNKVEISNDVATLLDRISTKSETNNINQE